MRVVRPLLRFGSLRTRLATLYATLFAVALIGVAAIAHLVIVRNAQTSVIAELTASGTVYDRIWALREASLKGAADVVARDFGFRSAVASGDGSTIASALDSLRVRAAVPLAMMVDPNGVVTGANGALAKAAAGVPFAIPDGQNDAVVVVDGRVFRLVLSPILAPTEIGWIVLAVPLDGVEMRNLERLSAIPLIATMLRRTDDGSWTSIDGTLRPEPALDRLVDAPRGARTPAVLDQADGGALALAKPLAGIGKRAEAALLIRYPYAAALAPYRPLELGIGAAGLVGLLLVVVGSRRLARSIARPIAALDKAARLVEEGAHAEVEVVGRDEIGRLAASFNRMATGIAEREQRIADLAFNDTLTGLPNRVSLRETLEQLMARSARTGADRHGGVAVLCLDLDRFKAVNDTLGHGVGDGLLRQIGDLLPTMAPDGYIARLSADEFAIVLAEPAPDRPRALAQAILDALATPLVVGEHPITIGVSIGIAVGPGDGADADTLLKSAGLALYRAKTDGRGVLRFFEQALDEAARKRRELELDLREAVSQGQFTLAFQPIFDLKADRIGGFEALLRWHHPTRGWLSPTEFIPIAEETGLIVPIGEWVMREACRTATRWPGHVRIAVNVSALQFRSPGFQSVVLQALAASALEPRRLEVEITESVFLDGEGPVVALLHRLRAMGVRIALDDFGTGYSSLSYLRSFPFDKIKIDRSFVIPVAEDKSAAAIVQAIIDLAAALNTDTTAEGVETEAQLAALRAQGCGTIQGYLFSRPVDAAAAMAQIAQPMRAVA
ncbi:putative bifunctional diguanylate cyclase/phosphodiesterase [Sphingomonas sp. 1P08PE]|uniref:putative bifunctional diguanylate cyclase/phosphodiesterase n=1 Tax=Sphingomonas sp. 1P08PE TaxID=554122 RepID=UPI0039A034D0